MINSPRNRVLERLERKEPVFGTYVTLPAAGVVEAAAIAGLDFVRMDAYHVLFNPESLHALVQTTYGYGITPWVRVRNDPWAIVTVLDLGTQILTIPNVSTADAARAAVDATFYPPKGEREMSRPLRARGMSTTKYLEWVSQNVAVSCQIEGVGGLENYREIVKVEGIDCIQTGRGDLSLALGIPGEIMHPKVLEAERRIIDAALEAGKHVGVVSPFNEVGYERIARLVELGVLVHTFESDYAVLIDGYSNAVKGARAAIGAPAQ